MKTVPLKLRGLAVALATGTLVLAVACGGNDTSTSSENASADSGSPTTAAEPPQQAEAPADAGTAPAVPAALITKEDVKLSPTIDADMASKGKGLYELKCQSCHSLGDNKVVGPGWKGVTARRQPEWIMNMVMHTEAMLDQDPSAQKLLEECLVRMPNQNLSKDQARQVLEFMRTLDKK